MFETRIPRFAKLAAGIGLGPNGEEENLASVGFDGYTFSPSEAQVSLDESDPPAGRILPASRYVELNDGVLLDLLLTDPMWEPTIHE